MILVTASSSVYASSYAGLMADLDRTEYEAGKLQDRIGALDASITIQNDAVTALGLELETRQNIMVSKQKVLRERLRGLMSFTVPEKLGFVTASKDFEDKVRSEAIISKMLRNDLKEHQELSRSAEELMSMKELVDQERKKLEEQRQKQTSVLEELKKKSARKKALLEKAKRTARSYQAFVTRLENSSRKIESMTVTGVNYLNTPSSLSDLVAPVKGRILNGFGRFWDQRIRNWIYNKGVTVQAEYGSKVSAVNDGVVSYSGWIPAYGKVVIINHSNGLFSVYGHLSRAFFEAGDKIKKGSVIAHSGDSGSTERPSLYFELRTPTNDIDPTPLFY